MQTANLLLLPRYPNFTINQHEHHWCEFSITYHPPYEYEPPAAWLGAISYDLVISALSVKPVARQGAGWRALLRQAIGTDSKPGKI